MSNIRTYLISTHFTNATKVNLDQLKSEINANQSISVDVSYVSQEGDNIVNIIFENQLSDTELTALNTFISTYTYIAPINPGVSRIYEAVISKSTLNPGDYTSIVAAINAGKKSIYVRNGVYVEPSDIIIPKGGQLIGESFGSVVIVGVQVTVDASNGVYESTGTISIENNSSNVTGVGTSFTNLSVGDYINIANNYMEIKTITDSMHIVLKETYYGRTISNSFYIAQKMYTGINLQNFAVVNSSKAGLFVRATRHSLFKNISCTSSMQSNFKFFEIGDCLIDTLVSSNGKSSGIEITNGIDLLLDTCNVFNNSSYGIKIGGKSDFLSVNRSTCTCNGSNGVYITDNSSEINLLNSYSKLNNAHGILINSSDENISISNCIANNNNGDGICSTTMHTILNNNIVKNNTGNGISISSDSQLNGNECKGNNNGMYVSGNKLSITSNIISSNIVNGIYISGNNCSITGNQCKNNGKGIVLAIGSQNNNIVSNQCILNTTIAIENSGTGNELTNNITI